MAADDTTNHIAGEAEETRERIGATIDELQDRLNPRRIVGDAVGSVQASGTELLNSGLGLARAHPAILAGAGLAIGLAMLGSRKLQGARVNFGDQSESYSDYDDDYSDRPGRDGASERFALMRSERPVGDNPLIASSSGWRRARCSARCSGDRARAPPARGQRRAFRGRRPRRGTHRPR